MRKSLQFVHPVLAARDVRESLLFFERLGFTRVFQDLPAAPKYAVIRRDAVELHLQWADSGQWAYPVDRPAYRFLVEDVDGLYEQFLAGGWKPAASDHLSPWAAPANTPWATREFHLRDPGENSLQFYRELG